MIVELLKYVKNTENIRLLSTPSLKDLEQAADYEDVIRENFSSIGKIAEENRSILDDVFFPMIRERKILSETEIDALIDLYDALVFGTGTENLDVPLANLISGYLWDVVKESGNHEDVVRIARIRAVVSYRMMNYTKRTYPYSESCEHFQAEGIEACDVLDSYLRDDLYSLLSLEGQKTVVQSAGSKSLFYEFVQSDFATNMENLDILKNALALADIKYYREALSDNEWIGFRMRIYEYFGRLLESGNVRGFTYSQCYMIHEYLEKLMDLWKKYPEICSQYANRCIHQILFDRSSFIVGEISGREYKHKLMEQYECRDTDGFTKEDVLINLLVPLEFIKFIKTRHITERDFLSVEQNYNHALNYVFKLPNSGTLVNTLDYLIQLLRDFREVPGGITLEEIGLNCLAALHPPTYVHSKMVASIARCLCKHLIRLHPEYFVGFMDIKIPEETILRREEIMDFAYHAALCHDFGKIAVMDTVFIYGRSIQDEEYDQIKAHTVIGSELLSKNPSTAAYSNIALGHHKFYDDSAGYPEIIHTGMLKEKVIIDIVAIADCMDAATDTTGRSFKTGKTIIEIIGELISGAGTRYAPFCPELFECQEVQDDVKHLLSETRNSIYRDTFVMLRRIQSLAEV